MAENQRKTILVVSAHSGDFVWRAGGAIALYSSRGWQVKIGCLSFGERGESARLWKEKGMTLEKARALRREKAQTAAAILGGDAKFLDCGDYPLKSIEYDFPFSPASLIYSGFIILGLLASMSSNLMFGFFTSSSTICQSRAS
jgi:LmbE family N-acetylglucosaminyl deacetylase